MCVERERDLHMISLTPVGVCIFVIILCVCVCGTTMMSLILHPLRVLDTYSRDPETVSELPKIAHST